jgi:predicted unusual protein kinase regulating ubiquinone biosynthesis (AarF/ABC1/UbiB family)
MGVKVFAAFGSVALQSRVRQAALLWKNGGNISEEEKTQLTMQTAEALKQALLGLGTTFIKGVYDILSFSELYSKTAGHQI